MISIDTRSQQGAQSSTLLPKVEVGSAGRVCSLKCGVGSALAYHTNVQGWKGSKRRLPRGLYNSPNLKAQDLPVNVFPPL